MKTRTVGAVVWCLALLGCFALPVSSADQPASANRTGAGAKDLFIRQSQSSELTNYGLQYSIELTRDGKTSNVMSNFPFRSGDQIRFRVKADNDGYMYILLASGSTGSKAVLFPLPNAPNDNFVRQGREYMLPAKGTIEFDDNPGVETVKLVFCRDEFDGTSADSLQRQITIRPKSQTIAPNFLVETPATLASGKGNNDDVVTMVSLDTTTALAVNLLLQHQPRFDSTAAVDRPSQADSPINDKWALVIGLSKFERPGLGLAFAAKDAQDFAKFLINEEHFKADHVKVLTNEKATYEQIMNEIRSRNGLLPANVKKGDLVVIYAASHATSEKDDPVKEQNFLMAYDTDPFDPAPHGIELQELSHTIKDRLDTDRVMIVLDTCHAGAGKGIGDEAPKSSITQLFQGTGQLVLAASGADQVSFGSQKLENGIFTRYLIEGLRKHGDVQKAFEYARPAVEKESLDEFKHIQSPVLKADEWHGKMLILSDIPAHPRQPVGSR